MYNSAVADWVHLANVLYSIPHCGEINGDEVQRSSIDRFCVDHRFQMAFGRLIPYPKTRSYPLRTFDQRCIVGWQHQDLTSCRCWLHHRTTLPWQGIHSSLCIRRLLWISISSCCLQGSVFLHSRMIKRPSVSRGVSFAKFPASQIQNDAACFGQSRCKCTGCGVSSAR